MNNIIEQAFANIDPNSKQFVKKNTEIIEEIYKLLEEQGISQKDLALKMGKKQSEVSKCLSGMHNMTLRSITSFEVALGADIIMTCSEAKERFKHVVNYVHIRTDARMNANIHEARSNEAFPAKFSCIEINNSHEKLIA